MVNYGLALFAPPLAKLPEAVATLLATIRDKPRKLLAVTKKMVQNSADISLAEGIDLEYKLFFEYMRNNPDPIEGVNAWLEKRLPIWK